VENVFGIEASTRGNKVLLRGEDAAVAKAETLLKQMQDMQAEGIILEPEDMRFILEEIKKNASFSLHDWVNQRIYIPSTHKCITPRSEGQRLYIQTVRKYDVSICIGPAGTGKSYLAMALAIRSLLEKEVGRIVLTRPAIEAGERLGFLPGDLEQKLDPYVRPLYDALFDILDIERANRLIEIGRIEIAPLAFMRGRTLNDSFIILDEAQNTTSEQMKMFLTRLGFGSKMVINGDITQIDLPAGKGSGLIEVQKIIANIDLIGVVLLTGNDVVRHRLVQKIIRAYEKHQRLTTNDSTKEEKD
jgi:phosphate starvation-inducible PhoH-like protein